MKIKSLLIGMLACTTLVGCNSSDDIVNNNENNDGLKNYVTKINLNFPDVNSGSRAYDPATDGEPEYANGDESEYAVTSITVRFYDSQKNALGESNNVTWGNVNPQPDHVTKTGVVSFRSVTQPYYAVVFVNDPNTGSAFSSKGIDDMKEVTLDDTTYPMSTVAKANNFFMTNASWLNGKAIVQEVNISDATEEVNENTSLKEALAQITTPADIYVERVVSKVQLGINLDNETVGKDGLYQIKYKTTGEENNDYSPYAIKIEAWGLNATNKTFYPMKKIENTWDASWSITGRSFWAIDPNYNSTTDEYLTADDFTSETLPTACLNYYKLEAVGEENNPYSMTFDNTTQANNILYCYENTYDPTVVATNSAATHVVMKAGYYEQGTDGTWAKPTGDYIYRINQVIFNEANMKARISAVLLSKYDFYRGETKLSDLANSINLTVDGKTAVTTISLAEGITVTAIGDKNATQTITDWNDKFNGGTIIGYKDGVCYYTIPIKHFSTAEETTELGHYGVVRNHWYILSVTSIAGFGEPGTDNPIIPEDEEELKDWVVKCNININAWAKVTQDNITVGGGTDVWN